jgi:alpha-tubulin suppressor-like RCC1 family protein
VKREPGRISLPAKVVALKYASSVWVAVLDDGRIAVWHGDFQPYFLDRPSDVTQVDHGVGRVCAVTKDEEVWCWWLRPWKPGRGVDMSADEELTRVEGVEHPVQVAVSAFHACALQKDGRVRCWGKNSEGQCGIGRFTETVDEPTLVVTKAGG